MLASQPWFLFQIEPDFHLLSLPRRASQKIEFVFSRQSRNLSTEASGACDTSPSRLNGKTWQATRRRNPPCSPRRSTQRCCYSSLLFENSAAHGRLSCHRQRCAIRIALLFFLVVEHTVGIYRARKAFLRRGYSTRPLESSEWRSLILQHPD